MKAGEVDLDKILAGIRVEFVDMAEDGLGSIDRALEAARGGVVLTSDQIGEIRRVAHNLKGLGGSVDYPLVTMVAHRFEDYLADLAIPAEANIDDLQQFVDRLRDAVDRGPDNGDGDGAALVRGLPSKSTFEIADVVKTDVEVMLVMPANAAARIVDNEFRACGYRLYNVASPFAAIEFAVRGRPDLIVASAVLEGLSGIDLICALKAIPATRRVPLALLTSFAPGHSSLAELPDGVPVIRKGAAFGDDLARALAHCGII